MRRPVRHRLDGQHRAAAALSGPGRSRAASRWLLVWAVAYGVTHHLGLLPGGLGDAGGDTRWADWLDLLVPWAVVGPALAALAAADADRRGWLVGLSGALLYVQGHGIHLAANSISNARGDAAPVHLWDEVVGHLLWYGGFAVIVVALARCFAMSGLRRSVLTDVVAVLTGVTWATNAYGADGLQPAGLAVAVGLAGYGWSLRRSTAGRLLLLAFVPGAVLLAVLLAVAGRP